MTDEKPAEDRPNVNLKEMYQDQEAEAYDPYDHEALANEPV